MTKIVLMGMGGVGGYFGGLLAKRYEKNTDIEIVFVARGAHLKELQTNGLKVIKGTTSFTARPALATSDCNAIGTADFICICTKSYDLEAAVEQLKPCIGRETVIVPLLNGIEPSEKIQKLLPHTLVASACTYIVSKLKAPGIVENMGAVETIFFGHETEASEKLVLFEKLLQDAAIDAVLSTSISAIVWEKFIFLSPTATATSYFDCCIGELLEKHEDTLLQLIEEVKHIALSLRVPVGVDITLKTLAKLKALPYEATSSMQRDFQTDRAKTELASLTYSVLQMGKQTGNPTPVYSELYGHLKQ